MFPKNFDGKISNKSVLATNCEPQEIGLLLMAALNKECKLTGIQIHKPREEFATRALERTYGSGL
jgi:hypothetical protein